MVEFDSRSCTPCVRVLRMRRLSCMLQFKHSTVTGTVLRVFSSVRIPAGLVRDDARVIECFVAE